ncbi:MAG: hypothetical protein K0M48_00275 [Thiobacillus sp.]|nr:hypothetical protein [Thiobacillus sp.]
MKTTIGLMVLPLLCAAGVAMAQEGGPPGAASAAGQAAEQEQVRVQAQATERQDVRRQGADMRRCLNLKDNRAIIRCAEPGRKP